MLAAVGIMLGFDEQNLEISDGSAGDAGLEVSSAVGELLEESVGVVILHVLGRVEILVCRHLNRVVVDENSRYVLIGSIHAIGGHAEKSDLDVFVPQGAAATSLESIEFDGGGQGKFAASTSDATAAFGNVHRHTTGGNDAHTLSSFQSRIKSGEGGSSDLSGGLLSHSIFNEGHFQFDQILVRLGSFSFQHVTGVSGQSAPFHTAL